MVGWEATARAGDYFAFAGREEASVDIISKGALERIGGLGHGLPEGSRDLLGGLGERLLFGGGPFGHSTVDFCHRGFEILACLRDLHGADLTTKAPGRAKEERKTQPGAEGLADPERLRAVARPGR